GWIRIRVDFGMGFAHSVVNLRNLRAPQVDSGFGALNCGECYSLERIWHSTLVLLALPVKRDFSHGLGCIYSGTLRIPRIDSIFRKHHLVLSQLTGDSLEKPKFWSENDDN